MMNEIINRIKDFILQHNTYFVQGYSNVYLDPTTGIVADSDKIVFPSQSEGNYFYLRVDGNPTLSNTPTSQMSECSFGLGFAVKMVLVAYVLDAEPDLLFANMASTLSKFSSQGLVFTNGWFTSDDVIMNELKTMKAEDHEKALQNIPDNATLVSIGFTLLRDVKLIPLNCIQNPCKIC